MNVFIQALLDFGPANAQPLVLRLVCDTLVFGPVTPQHRLDDQSLRLLRFLFGQTLNRSGMILTLKRHVQILDVVIDVHKNRA